MVNFGQVTPNLYRGGLVRKGGIDELKKVGINVVVDLHAWDKREEAEVTRLGMQYVAIPFHCPFPSDKPFAQFLEVMKENPNKKVFVHCRLGEDRTGMAVAAYRMAVQGWTPEEAMNEMKAFGFTRTHHFICPGMARYEARFPERLKEDPIFRGLTAETKAQESK